MSTPPVYPRADRELTQMRQNHAPDQFVAFQQFSQQATMHLLLTRLGQLVGAKNRAQVVQRVGEIVVDQQHAIQRRRPHLRPRRRKCDAVFFFVFGVWIVAHGGKYMDAGGAIPSALASCVGRCSAHPAHGH